MKSLRINELRLVEVFQLRHVEKWTLKQIADHMGLAIKSVQGIVQGRTHLRLAVDHPLRRACVRAERKKLHAHRRSRSKECRTWKPSLKKRVRVRRGKLRKGVNAYWGLKSIRKAARAVGVSPTALHRELLNYEYYRRFRSKS